MISAPASFISQLTSTGVGRTVAETIIALGRAFNMTTVAEGVETPEQLALLVQMGCEQSQGYLHSRPLPRADIETLIRNGLGGILPGNVPNLETTSIAQRG